MGGESTPKKTGLPGEVYFFCGGGGGGIKHSFPRNQSVRKQGFRLNKKFWGLGGPPFLVAKVEIFLGVMNSFWTKCLVVVSFFGTLETH